MVRLLLCSSSKVFGYANYLEQPAPIMRAFLGEGVKKVLFIPYAAASGDYDEYVRSVETGLNRGVAEADRIAVEGIHRAQGSPADAVRAAQAVWIGGGNSFKLLKDMYEHGLVEALREVAVEKGTPLFGHSAGSNVLGQSIRNTNDMPIVYPPSFDAVGLIPFNINPHFVAADPTSKHQGETREQRLKEFHQVKENQACKVLGLTEGAALQVIDKQATLLGNPAILFEYKDNEQATTNFAPGDDLSFLL